MEIQQELQHEVDVLAGDLQALSKRLYEHPETCFQEHRACAWLSEYLEGRGFAVERGVGGVDTAFYAHIPGRTAAPKVAILAEYDALPKIGHGCGHNLIAAASIGAAVALRRRIDALDGSVVVIGTPAEEGGGGKILLLNAGVFDGVDAAMMFHPSSATVVGGDALGRIKCTVEFFGKAAHASACPEDGINALDAMIAFFSGIGLLRQQLQSEARVHGIITHGGDAPNITPDYTAAELYVRALHLDYLETVFAKVRDCAAGAAAMTGAEVTITTDPLRYEPFKRNAALELVCQKNMEALGFEIEPPKSGGLGSTDLGNLSHVCPTIQPVLAICGTEIAGHSQEMAEATLQPLGQDVLLKAAKMLAMTACDYLSSADVREQVVQEFHRETSV